MESNEKSVIIGGLYHHYHGGVYQVLDVAIHAETGEDLVIYKDQLNITYARPKTRFLELVSPDTPRFRYLNWINDKEDRKLCDAFFAFTPVEGPAGAIHHIKDPDHNLSLRYTLLRKDTISGVEIVLDKSVNVGISLRPQGASLRKDIFQLRGDLVVSLAFFICPENVIPQAQSSPNSCEVCNGYLVGGVLVLGEIRPLTAVYSKERGKNGRITRIILRFTDEPGGEFVIEDRRPEDMNELVYWFAHRLFEKNKDEALAKPILSASLSQPDKIEPDVLKRLFYVRYNEITPEILTDVWLMSPRDLDTTYTLHPLVSCSPDDVIRLRGDLVISLSSLIDPGNVKPMTQSHSDPDYVLDGYCVLGNFIAGKKRDLGAILHAEDGRITKISLLFLDKPDEGFFFDLKTQSDLPNMLLWLHSIVGDMRSPSL